MFRARQVSTALASSVVEEDSFLSFSYLICKKQREDTSLGCPEPDMRSLVIVAIVIIFAERLTFNYKSGPLMEKEMQIHFNILAGKFHGQRSWTGYILWICKRVGHNLATKQQMHSP